MKLFFGTNEQTTETPLIKMLEVSVKSALKNTNFEIFVIFDGDKNKLNLPKEINIIEHRHRCYETFQKSDRCLKTSSSAFLRTEIPYIIKKLGFDDEYCLYTDYDVIFQPSDYSELDYIKPQVLAASPESNQHDWDYINSGVMLLNVNYFYNKDEEIIKYINDNFENLEVWDQTMYNNLFIKNYTKLPLVFNWKPYWGINQDAKIIHFHGVKPFQINSKDHINSIPVLKLLHSKNPNAYDYYNELFNNFL